MNRMLLYTLVILALALVQACQIHHNLTFPAVSQVSGCSAESLGHLRYSNQSLTRDLPTTTTSLMSLRLEYFNCGKPFGALGL